MFLSSIYGIFEYFKLTSPYLWKMTRTPELLDGNPDLVALLNYSSHNIFLSFCTIICMFYLYKNKQTRRSNILKYILLLFVLVFVFNLFIESGRMGQFNFIFIDPPYDYSKYKKIKTLIFENNLVKKEGCLIIEHDKNTIFNDQNIELRKYGTVHFSIF